MATQPPQPIAATSAAPRAWQRGLNAVRWLAPESFEWALALLYSSVFLTFSIRMLPMLTGRPYPWLDVVVVALALFGAFALDRWCHWRFDMAPAPPTAWLTLLARIALIEIVVLIDKSDATYFLYLVVPFSATITIGSWVGWGLGVLLWARMSATIVGDPYMDPLEALQALVLMPVGIVFVLVMARLIVAERTGRMRTERLFAELETSHAQLTAYASQVEALTLTAERNRLARDIHDSLGHYLTTINVQLRTATAFRARDAARAERAIVEATRLTHVALEDVRRSVGMLRTSGEVFVLRDALQTLIAPLQSEQLRLDLQVHGETPAAAPATQMALFRAAQETLTNIQRHAAASHVTLTLQQAAAATTLTIADDGCGFDPDALDATASHGLRGMRERLALVGGTVTVQSAPGAGASVTLHAPHHGLRPAGMRDER